MPEITLVSIVIPNWNGKKFLADCLNSLRAQTYRNYEIVVIDNGSIDGSCEFLEKNYPETTIIRFSKNTGFSAAVNSGINKAKGPYIALLNNDTVVDADWLATMVEALERTPEAGSIACKMLSFDDHTLLDGAGDGYRRGGLPGRIGHGERDLGQFDTERFVLGPCGGACLYRRQVFEKIGFLDEDYFAYLEDVDLGLRAQSAGYKCLYVPKAIVYHLGCGTTGSGYSPMVVRLSAQNNINTMVKNLPAPLLLKFLPEIIYWQAFYLAVVVMRGGQLFPWLQGIVGAILLFPRMLVKHMDIKQKRAVSTAYLESIIVQSESELKASKARLYQQTRESNTFSQSQKSGAESGVVNSRLMR